VARAALSGPFAPVPVRIRLQQSPRILLVQDGSPQPGHPAFALGQPFGHAKRLVNPDDLLQIALGIVAKCSTHLVSSAAHRTFSFVSRRANPSKVPVWNAVPDCRKSDARPRISA
tara:strand:- start:770 stop:1114 length:345 start_codon:yes stop_codon:yes gene_type:complete